MENKQEKAIELLASHFATADLLTEKDYSKILVESGLETESYYICPNCGELTTETDRLEECGSGGNGYCGCEFTISRWSEEYETLDAECQRYYSDYIPISKDLFEELNNEKNTKLRLDEFNTIPIEWRMKYKSK